MLYIKNSSCLDVSAAIYFTLLFDHILDGAHPKNLRTAGRL